MSGAVRGGLGVSGAVRGGLGVSGAYPADQAWIATSTVGRSGVARAAAGSARDAGHGS